MILLIKKHIIFFIIFLLFFIVKVFSLFVSHDIWWDSSVFLGMGKYIYSFGDVGLWEASRPIVWPLILGFFWKSGLDAVFFGKLIVVLFSLGILSLTYIIAYELFDKKIAVIAALFLALSQTFFLFNNILHTEIPSTFFLLLGFYFFVKERYEFSGLALGIAFMTRFFHIIAFVPLFLILIYLIKKKKESIKSLLKFSLFFMIPIIPYLILNMVLYKNPLFPFLLQSFLTKYTGWVFYQPFNFYFIGLVKENILVLFSIIGLIFIFRKFEIKKISLALMFLFLFIPYTLIAHKETRLLISTLPFLYILTSYGIFYFIDLFKKKKTLILSLLLVIFLILNIPKLKFDKYEDNLDLFYDYVKNTRIDKGLWISNPAFIAYSDYKADELIYYPLFNSKKIDKLTSNLENAKYILINTCDILPCPEEDVFCTEKTDDFISLLKERFILKLNQKNNQCEYFIFSSN
ncbi:glycosyltransferase family 39 protein [archaeon AH-315-M20]|nr:glycosyltransferase family 39 protein [archaeon AH-315-M20]